ncbi:hypothetical protein PTKIN_Ptkin03bG0195400 [Pterospermum kingtungense]
MEQENDRYNAPKALDLDEPVDNDCDFRESDYAFDDDDIMVDNEAVNKPDNGRKWPEFNVVSGMDDPIFCVDMLFTSKQQLEDTIKNAIIKDKVNIQMLKNDKIRLRAVCTSPCKWLLYARKFK